jgi:hypothetical protein
MVATTGDLPKDYPDADQFQLEYMSPHGDVALWNRDGVPWPDAPLPPRFHRCKAQTAGWTNWFEFIERCACGAARMNRHPLWINKNETRKNRRKR